MGAVCKPEWKPESGLATARRQDTKRPCHPATGHIDNGYTLGGGEGGCARPCEITLDSTRA
jgi:hypothetical protein